MSKNALFRGERTGFFFPKQKETKNNTKKNQTNKKGAGPSELALWATSPDP